MLERDLREKLIIPKLASPVDAWLRREDTWLARGLKRISPLEGTEYRMSQAKRNLEIAAAVPFAAAAALPTAMLVLASSLEKPIGHPFYDQVREKAPGVSIKIRKIRTMPPGSDANVSTVLSNTKSFDPEKDPRVNRIGRIIRAFEFDELPQVWQVLQGELSFIDIRMAARYAMEYMKEKRPETYPEWEQAYYEGVPGLISMNSAMNNFRKDDLKRHHYDLFYANHASLGLDIYILFRLNVRMLSKLEEKLRGIT